MSKTERSRTARIMGRMFASIVSGHRACSGEREEDEDLQTAEDRRFADRTGSRAGEAVDAGSDGCCLCGSVSFGWNACGRA